MQAVLSRDFVGGMAAIVIGAFYLVFAYDLRASALDDLVGPGGMPRAYGWVLVGLGFALCITTMISRWRADISAEWDDQGRRIAWAAGLLGIGIAYLLIVKSLGYLLSMCLLMAATMIYHGERPSAKVIGTSIFGAAILWALFVFVLGVSMPPGLMAYIGF